MLRSLSLVLLTMILGCSHASIEKAAVEPASIGPITIYTVNYPLQYFAKRIGGGYVNVVFPAPREVDPAYWTPSPQVITNYQNADLILLNGASYAKWTQSISLPRMKLLNTSEAFREQLIDIKEVVTHSHGPSAKHAHNGLAFTTWLDPRLAIAQAATIRSKLISLRPEQEDAFHQGFDSLKADLEKLDAKITAIVSQENDVPLFFSHPVYQYFARRYDLNAESVHWEPNEMPSEAMWGELASLQGERAASWMIWEDEPNKKIAVRLREINIKSTIFTPCGNIPSQGDYISQMSANVENLKQVFNRED